MVEHSDDLPCRGLFLLHQGIQRRIRITIVHEPTPEVKWKDIRELVVGMFIIIVFHFVFNFFFLIGRIRNTPEPADELDDDSCVLSLGLFPGEVMEVPGDDRFEHLFECLKILLVKTIFYFFLDHFSVLKQPGIQVYTILIY